MDPKFFIGIDISKATLDLAVVQGNSLLSQHKIENKETAIVSFIELVKSQHGCTAINSYYCAEQMGVYGCFLTKVCINKKLKICLESPLQIKRSLGIQRGKTDALDAVRIAQYAERHFSKLKLWLPPAPVIEQLKYLSTVRKRLLKMKTGLLATRTMEKYYQDKTILNKTEYYFRTTLPAIEQDLEQIESEISGLLEGDEYLQGLVKIITSVPGVGKVVATELIICTNGFQEGWTAKKFASYCGIAPFERTSGTSVRGKTRVSPLANRSVKALLHLPALSLLRIKSSFIARYYERKVAEGKHKMSVINSIKNKLIHRVFACVRGNHLFVESS